jgi:hypothetical protein
VNVNGEEDLEVEKKVPQEYVHMYFCEVDRHMMRAFVFVANLIHFVSFTLINCKIRVTKRPHLRPRYFLPRNISSINNKLVPETEISLEEGKRFRRLDTCHTNWVQIMRRAQLCSEPVRGTGSQLRCWAPL